MQDSQHTETKHGTGPSRWATTGWLGLALLITTGITPGCGDGEPSEEVKADLLTRWNTIARKPEHSFDFLGRRGDVAWEEFLQFPHPTYRGGSGEAYRAFAAVLAEFLESSDNFDFLDRNDLFRHPFRYDLPASPSRPTTFVEMAEQLSADGHFARVPEATRTTLKRQLVRIGER